MGENLVKKLWLVTSSHQMRNHANLRKFGATARILRYVQNQQIFDDFEVSPMAKAPASGKDSRSDRLKKLLDQNRIIDKGLIIGAHRKLALKMSINYFMDVLGIKKPDIIAVIVDHTSARKKEVEEGIRVLLRQGGRKPADENHISSIQNGLRAFVKEAALPAPYFIDRIFHTAGIKDVDRESIPNFIDPLGLFQESLAKSNVTEILTGFAGCWDVYRVGTASTSAVDGTDEMIRINRSFLNILPTNALTRDHKSIAEFSIYQKADRSRTGDAESKLSGIVTHADQFVTLIGEKELHDQHVHKLGNIAVMMWPYPKERVDEGIIPGFSGIELVPNSDGNVIGAYFFASRISGSQRLTKSDFKKLRDQRLSALGTLPYEDIKAGIKDSDIKQIDELIAISSSHLVFSAAAHSLNNGSDRS